MKRVLLFLILLAVYAAAANVNMDSVTNATNLTQASITVEEHSSSYLPVASANESVATVESVRVVEIINSPAIVENVSREIAPEPNMSIEPVASINEIATVPLIVPEILQVNESPQEIPAQETPVDEVIEPQNQSFEPVETVEEPVLSSLPVPAAVAELVRESQNATVEQRVSFAALVHDATGHILDAQVVVKNQAGNIVAQDMLGARTIAQALDVPIGPLDVAIEFTQGPITKLTLDDANLSLSQGFVRVDDPPETNGFAHVYAIDPSAVEFAQGQVRAIAQGNQLYKCKEWNFDARVCEGNWTHIQAIVPGQEYAVAISQDDPAFGEIIATDAVHLNEQGTPVENIYPQISAIDGNWSSPILANQSVQVAFEKNLTNGNVIDFIGRSNGTVVNVQVFRAGTGELVGSTGPMDLQEWKFIELANVSTPSDMFDLRIVALPPILCSKDDDCVASQEIPFMEFDYIHDEAATANGTAGAIVYSESASSSPRYRNWNKTTQNWAGETTALANTEEAQWVVLRSSHEFENQFVAAFLTSDANISLQVGQGYNSSGGINWTTRYNLSASVPNTGRRSLDLATEDVSGNILVVYETSSSGDTGVAFRVWNGTSLGSEQAINTSSGGAAHWIRAVPRPFTNEVMILTLNSADDLFATLWNGSALVNATGFTLTTDSGVISDEVFDFAWQANGDGLVVYRENNSASTQYRTFNAVARNWSFAGNFFTLNGGTPNELKLCADPTSNFVGFISSDSTDDVNVMVWNGTAVETSPSIPSENAGAEPNSAPARNVACTWSFDGRNATFLFVNAPGPEDDLISFIRYNKTAWSVSDANSPEQSATVTGGASIERLEAYANPFTYEIQVLTFDAGGNNDLHSALWNRTFFATSSAGNYFLETSLTCGGGDTQCADFAWNSFDPAPNVTLTVSSGSSFNQSDIMNITVNVSDNNQVDKVNITIYLPNGSTQQSNMTLVQGNSTSGLYWINFTNTTLAIGRYNFTIEANDSSTHNNHNYTSGFFIIANVTSCPAVLFANTTLVKNISGTGSCLSFGDDHLTLDCNGNVVSYDSSGNGGVAGLAASRVNLSVRNCVVVDAAQSGAFGIAINLTSVNQSTFTNITVQTNGTSANDALLMVDSFENSVVNFTIRSNGSTTDNAALHLVNSSRNNLTQGTLSANGSSNNSGIMLQNAHGNSLVNLLINASGLSSYGALFSAAENNTFANVSLQSAQWVNASSSVVNFTNVTFTTGNASLLYARTVTLNGTHDLTREKISLTANSTFVNGSNLSFLNSSAQIALFNINFSTPAMRVDLEDTGSFVDCTAPRCVNVSFAGNVFTFNVSGFSTYAAAASIQNVTFSLADAPEPATRAGQLSYTFTVSNTGTETIYNVTLNATYPSGVVFNSASPQATGNVTFSIGNISAGTLFAVNVTVNVTAANGTVMNASGNVTYANALGQLSSQTANASTTVRGTPLIFASATGMPDPVTVGNTLTYSVLVNNSGDDTAFNVTLIESYPSGVTFNGSLPSPSVGNTTVSIGTLAPNQSMLVNVTVNVSSGVANGTVLNNSFSVVFANISGVNSSVINSTLTTAEAVFVANVSASMSDTPDPAVRGSQLNYTITINNTGSDGAFNVTVVESYPQGVAFHSASPNPTGNTVFALGNLSAGQGTTVNITVNVTASNASVLNNTAVINFSNATGLTTVIAASVLTTVRGYPNMTLSINDTPDAVLINKTVLYQLLLNNSGDDTAFNVSLALSYPSGTVFNASAPIASVGNATFNLDNFSPNQTLLVNVTLNITDSLVPSAQITLFGQLSFGNASGTNVSVNASALTTVRGFPVARVAMEGSASTIYRGEAVSYTVNVTNAGYETAYNATAVIGYPVGMVFLSASPAPSGGNATFSIGNLSVNGSSVIVVTLNTTTGLTDGAVLNGSVNVTFVNDSSETWTGNASLITTVLQGAAPAVAAVSPVNRTNLTVQEQVFSAAVTDDSAANFTCLLAIDSVTNMTNASVENNTQVNFSAQGIVQGNHTWNISCTDFSANSNASETRTLVVDLTGPKFNSLTVSPNSSASLDPGVAAVFTANVSDNYTAADTVVLHVLFEGGSVQNTSMTLNATTGLFNATVNLTQSGTYAVFLSANDSFGNAASSSVVNVTVALDNVWTAPSGFGAFSATPGQNMSLGTLVVNNTGDYRRAFNLSSTLNGTVFNETSFTLSAGQVRYVQVNVSVPLISGVLEHNLTINSSAGDNSIASEVNGTGFMQTNVSFLIVTVDDAFLFTNLTVLPDEVFQGQSTVELQAQVKNIGTRNASNVTLNITLPGWTVQGGSLGVMFGLLEPNDTEVLNVVVSVPENATLGYNTVTTIADGLNNSEAVLSTQNLTLNGIGTILVSSVAVVFGQSSAGPTSSGSSGGASEGSGSGGPSGPAPGTFSRSVESAVLVTNETIEVVRGSRIVFPLVVKNVYNNSLMRKVDLEVEGSLNRYMQWTPASLENILYGRSKAFEVELAAPIYANRSELNVTFAIRSNLESEGITYRAGIAFSETFKKVAIEYKTVRIVIREITPAQAKEKFVDVQNLYAQVVAKKYPTGKADILLELLRNAMYAQNYEDAVYIAGKLKLLLEKELEAGGALEALRERIAKAKDDGLDVSETESILALAVKAFELEDFEKALARADEAVAVQFIELKGAFNLLRFIEKYWWMLMLVAGAGGVGMYLGWKNLYVRYIAHRMEILEKEQVNVQKAVKELQEQYFVKKSIGSGVFYNSMEKLMKKTEGARGAILRLRLRRARLLGSRKALDVELKERADLQSEMRKLQEEYFVKGKLSAKRYALQSESLRLLVVEVDAHIALLRKKVKK